jgi:predicted 3-demethylubiquinone-9 3-methyltransferase (glyoxalase superfamily)
MQPKNTICLWFDKDDAMMTMRKIDVAAIDAARRG